MSYALFIDDERDPPRDGRPWRIARSLAEVEAILREYGPPSLISFDHDLGEDRPTGHDIARKLIEGDMGDHPGTGFAVGLPPGLRVVIHSQNPVGAANIRGLIDNYLRVRDPQR